MSRWTLIASVGFALSTSACANSPASVAAAPRVDLPAAATRPCEMTVLGDHPTEAELDEAYAVRGAQIVACDAARKLAVETHEAEHRLEDEYQRRMAGAHREP